MLTLKIIVTPSSGTVYISDTMLNYTGRVKGSGGRPGDVARVKLDASKAIKLGWRPPNIIQTNLL